MSLRRIPSGRHMLEVGNYKRLHPTEKYALEHPQAIITHNNVIDLRVKQSQKNYRYCDIDSINAASLHPNAILNSNHAT